MHLPLLKNLSQYIRILCYCSPHQVVLVSLTVNRRHGFDLHASTIPSGTFPTLDTVFCLDVNGHLHGSNTVRVRVSHNCSSIIGRVIEVATI